MDTANNPGQPSIKNTVGVPPTSPKAHQKTGGDTFLSDLHRKLHADSLALSRQVAKTDRAAAFQLLELAKTSRFYFSQFLALGL